MAVVAVASGLIPLSVKAHCWVGLGFSVIVAVTVAVGRAIGWKCFRDQFTPFHCSTIVDRSSYAMKRRETAEIGRGIESPLDPWQWR